MIISKVDDCNMLFLRWRCREAGIGKTIGELDIRKKVQHQYSGDQNRRKDEYGDWPGYGIKQ